jgi:hypothetical protein
VKVEHLELPQKSITIRNTQMRWQWNQNRNAVAPGLRPQVSGKFAHAIVESVGLTPKALAISAQHQREAQSGVCPVIPFRNATWS